jgi:hypothetical protein
MDRDKLWRDVQDREPPTSGDGVLHEVCAAWEIDTKPFDLSKTASSRVLFGDDFGEPVGTFYDSGSPKNAPPRTSPSKTSNPGAPQSPPKTHQRPLRQTQDSDDRRHH